MTIKLIVYDLDGTLIDSAQTVLSIVNEMRFEMGKEPLEKRNLIRWISLGGIELIANALEIEPSVAQRSLDDFRRRYLKYSSREADLYPEVRQTLDALKHSNIDLAICTNKPRNLVEKILSELYLGSYFGHVLAGGDLKTQKPHPQNLLECLGHFQCGPESAILVGDSTVDQEIARSCQVPFAFFRPGYNDGVDLNQVAITLDVHEDLLGLNGLKIHS